MRITAGEAKGRSLRFPARTGQRPTTDFLRQALFNLLGEIEDTTFLDVYAGSGSVGLEAASRKAKKVVFIEKNKDCVAAIRENLSKLGYEARSLVLSSDVRQGWLFLFEKQYAFDYIFADPPYDRAWIAKTMGLLFDFPVLKKDGMLILQHSVRENTNSMQAGWLIADQRRYGDTFLTFIRKVDS